MCNCTSEESCGASRLAAEIGGNPYSGQKTGGVCGIYFIFIFGERALAELCFDVSSVNVKSTSIEANNFFEHLSC